MSLFNRKPRGKSHRTARISTADLASSLFPVSRIARAPAAVAPRRRRAFRHSSYSAGRPRHPLFRVT